MRLLVQTGDAHLLRPRVRAAAINARLRGLMPWLKPAAAEAVRFVIECRDLESFAHWLRGNRPYLEQVLRESER